MAKKPQKLEKEKATHAEDRISKLPDVLLTYILCFLSTKDSVRTSVLSTRWKSVWAFVPALEVGDWEFLPRRHGFRAGNKRRKNFLAFVSRFLTQSNIYCFRKFCLRSLEYYDPSLIESWICAAKNPNIEELLLDMKFLSPRSKERGWTLFLSYRPLDLVFQHKNSLPYIGKLCIACESPPCVVESLVSIAKEWKFTALELGTYECQMESIPPSLFALEKLIFLRLFFCPTKLVPTRQVPKSSIRFPNLKFLYLYYVDFTDDESAANLISSCPVLEELCFDGYLENLLITSPTLKRLEVGSKCCVLNGDLVIDTPALEILQLQASFENCVLGRFGALVTAKVGFEELYPSFEVMRKFPNVMHLSLGYFPNVLQETGSYEPLTLNHLTRLEFRQSWPWRFIIDLLKMAPCLKDLFIKDMEADFHMVPKQDVSNCLVSNLSTIVILIGENSREKNLFQVILSYLEVIRYFLKNSKVLKKMNIVFLDGYLEEVIKHAVSGFPKGSVSCHIEFWTESPRFLEGCSLVEAFDIHS